MYPGGTSDGRSALGHSGRLPLPQEGCRRSPGQNTSAIVVVKAFRSSGLRLLIKGPGPVVSTTTSRSTQCAPALAKSVRRLGQEVSVRPRTTSASTSVQGTWQMTANAWAYSTEYSEEPGFGFTA